LFSFFCYFLNQTSPVFLFLILGLISREFLGGLSACQASRILGNREANMLIVFVPLSDEMCVFCISFIILLWGSSSHLNEQKSAEDLPKMYVGNLNLASFC